MRRLQFKVLGRRLMNVAYMIPDEAVGPLLPHVEVCLLSSQTLSFTMHSNCGSYLRLKITRRVSRVRDAELSYSLHASAHWRQSEPESPHELLNLAVLEILSAALSHANHHWIPTDALQRRFGNSMINSCSSISLQFSLPA